MARQVDVVREVPGEVVGAKLVFRIKSLVLEILRPLLQLRPIKPGEVGVAFHLRDGRHQDQQVAAFLDGHLVVLAAFAAAIDLAVGLRVSAEVVRREGKRPASLAA